MLNIFILDNNDIKRINESKGIIVYYYKFIPIVKCQNNIWSDVNNCRLVLLKNIKVTGFAITKNTIIMQFIKIENNMQYQITFPITKELLNLL